jgi:hypothetical protein
MDTRPDPVKWLAGSKSVMVGARPGCGWTKAMRAGWSGTAEAVAIVTGARKIDPFSTAEIDLLLGMAVDGCGRFVLVFGPP